MCGAVGVRAVVGTRAAFVVSLCVQGLTDRQTLYKLSVCASPPEAPAPGVWRAAAQRDLLG